jgi:hypothetical protein
MFPGETEESCLYYVDTDSFVIKFTKWALDRILIYSLELFGDTNELFDHSNYPDNHILYSETNKNKFGCIQDEFAGVSPTSAHYLGPKSYSASNEVDMRKVSGKGIKKPFIPSHSAYKEVAGFSKVLRIDVRSIRSINKENVMYVQTKIGLTPGSIKRWFTSPNDSLPHGYKGLCKIGFTSALAKHLHLHNIRGETRKYNNEDEDGVLMDHKHRRYCKMGNEDEPLTNTCGQKRKQEDIEKIDPLVNRIKRYRRIAENFK